MSYLILLLALLLLCVQLSVSYRAVPVSSLHRTSATRRNLFGSPEPPKNSPAPNKKDAGGLFGGMGNIMESMKKAQEIAKQAELLNKELAETMLTTKDASGQVSVTFNGLGVPVAIQFSDSILTQGSDAVSAASTQALREGYEKSQASMIARMQSLYANAGIALPPQK